MSQSVKELVEKIKYGSTDSNNKLEQIQSTLIETGLIGFNKEKIVYNMTSDIKNYLRFIEDNVRSIKKSDFKEIIILDAYSSATIEGAKTTVENVRRAFHSKKKSYSDEMVINTVYGTNYALTNRIDDNNIRYLWEIIVNNVCENENVKGEKYRNGQVYVGSNEKIIHTPCEHEYVQKYMDKYFAYKDENTLIGECIKHFYFVYIHPFCDGNGRLARILLSSSLIKDYNENIKYISISNEIMKNVGDYYKTLTESEYIYGKTLNITTFIEYLLERICRAMLIGLTNDIVLEEVDKYIIKKINRDGIVVKKLISKKHGEYAVRTSLKKLVDNKMLYRVREGRQYRYFVTDIKD